MKIRTTILTLAFLFYSGLALALPPLPGPTPSAPVQPKPDTRTPISLCVQDSAQPTAKPICNRLAQATVGDTLTLSIQATPLPTSLNMNVNGENSNLSE